MTTTLRRIEPVSLAKIYAAIYGILALALALPAGCMLIVAGGAMSEAFGGGSSGFGVGMGLFAMVFYPIAGAIAGFIGGLVTGFVYNLVADRVGGVQIELDGLGATDIL